MGWNPIKQAHSIDAVYWRVFLDQPLVQRHQALIQEQDTRLRKVLPKIETAQRLLEIGPNGVTVHTEDALGGQNAPAMLTYQRFFPNGQLELQLEVNGQNVTVTSHSYSQWSKTGDVVRRILSDVGSALRTVDDISIAQIELEYRDVFWWDGDWHAEALGDLLQPDERLAPKWVFQAGIDWHSDQGWVVPPDGFEDETMIERMSLQGMRGTVNNKPCPMLVAHTTLRWRLGLHGQPLPLRIQDAFSALKEVGSFRKGAQDRFDVMHKRSVVMFSTVVTPKVRERIGIT